MTLTEEEAKTKRCQESFGDRNVTPEGFMISAPMMSMGAGMALATSPSMCIGSACMAWRWAMWNCHPDGRRADGTAGYCGKAGTP